ncbi:REP-associated tyrosine transposase [Alienimonas californiensis]|uniref:Transposase IS200 like protein n=1 Tax=Alienimonas californiensis TaxID=2527989 RepID=A0A517P669_9PLAN|nr:transposase [Alienimonas californiensis]QDT14879.1 Transposase IS200 like protein [Alienimonas californiensis]
MAGRRNYNDPGHAHCFTFCCYRRLKLLSKERTRVWVCEAIAAARDELGWDVWAYVLMPEHVHLLACPRERIYDVAAFRKAVKEPVGRRAMAYLEEQAPEFLPRLVRRRGRRTERLFWQSGGGHDRNLFTPEAVRAQVDYLHLNPVRRGLCERPGDWPWSSAADYDARNRGAERPASPLRIEFDSLPT